MYEVVERPPKSYVDETFIVELVNTAKNGNAIKMDFNPSTFGNWQQSVRNRMSEVGYKVSYRKNTDDNTLVIWAVAR